MSSSEQRTITLPTAQASYVDALIESGEYASFDDVIEAGIEALQKQEEPDEHLLQKAIIPVAEAMHADPSRGIPAEEVFADIRALGLDSASSAAQRSCSGSSCKP